MNALRRRSLQRAGLLTCVSFIAALALTACTHSTAPETESLSDREYELILIGGAPLPRCFSTVVSDSLWLRSEIIAFSLKATVSGSLSTSAWPDPLSLRESIARLDYRTWGDSIALGRLTTCGTALCLDTWRRGRLSPDSLVLVDGDSLEYRYVRRLAAP